MKPNQMRSNSLKGAAALLQAISEVIGGAVRARKQELNDGSILTHALHGTYRAHKLELRANEEMIVADVEARYGQFHLLIFKSITHDSVIRYQDAQIVKVNAIAAAIRGKAAFQKPSCSPRMLAKIVDGLGKSPEATPDIQSFCGISVNKTISSGDIANL